MTYATTTTNNSNMLHTEVLAINNTYLPEIKLIVILPVEKYMLFYKL